MGRTKKSSAGSFKAATGTPKTAQDKVKRRVDRIAGQSSKMTIGKTSGASGMKERMTNKYKNQGYDKIKPIYKTTSSANANKVEKMAIKHAKAQAPRKVGNKNVGGGGPSGKEKTKYVYGAFKSD